MSKYRRVDQLVKYKDTILYLQLYIPTDHMLNVWLTYVMISETMRKQRGKDKETTPTT